MTTGRIEQAYSEARERYAEFGADADRVLDVLTSTPLSVHCWQGDDVSGFETSRATLAGSGLAVTGSYPGRARNADELRKDLD